ncbi:MAG: MFS transporter [Homoserinimonas sp.]
MQEQQSSDNVRRVPRAVRPFLRGQYRLLVGALSFSLFGGGVWLVAVVFQVIRLGGGPTELSYVALAASLGLVGAVLVGGVVADRVPQRNIMLVVESVKVVGTGAAATLAMLDVIQVWHLAVVALILGIVDGFFYPAYSALLPSILPADDLLAANGVEGVLRPAVMQAAGPAAASLAIGIHSPALAFVVVAGASACAAVWLALMKPTPVRREPDAEKQHPLRVLFVDLRGGFLYMVGTPWLLGSLIFACLLVLVIMGPIEVLLPFAVTNQTGGGPGAFALALAAFGGGAAVGSMAVASLPLPRRYLTIMLAAWGAGSIPLAVIGFTSLLWVMVIALFMVGFTFSAGGVIWGTLLQRRVPPALLGRVSSLDFFVSLALMPVSMALAGPVGEGLGIPITFVIAGLVPMVVAALAIVIFRMPKDELDHPLDPQIEQAEPGAPFTP